LGKGFVAGCARRESGQKKLFAGGMETIKRENGEHYEEHRSEREIHVGKKVVYKCFEQAGELKKSEAGSVICGVEKKDSKGDKAGG